MSQFSYVVDRAGLRQQATETIAGVSRSINYDYDGLRRLTGAMTSDTSGATSSGATYDVAGNITRQPESGPTLSPTYDAANQRAPWSYDAAGNLLSDGTTSYTYDALNRVRTRASGSGTSARTTTPRSRVAGVAAPAVARVDAAAQPASVVQAWGNVAPAPLPQTGVQTRTITYDYDGLNRLTSAVEAGMSSNVSGYGYDLAGNRTAVTTNGTTTSQSYNAANQVVGWTYDAAGNLLSDGTTSSSYDALNRALTTGGITNTYNADGVLVQQGATRYTQDLAGSLSQILGDGTSTYVYGQERLFAQASGARLWYTADVLGSVRQTLSDSGVVLGSVAYDPWGQVQQGSVPTFGFTGELQQGSDVYLRARWYNATNGSFTAFRWRTSESFDEIPYSHHPYAYALGNPVLYTDPAGTCQLPDGSPCPEPAPGPLPSTPTPTPTPRPVAPPSSGMNLGSGNDCWAGYFKQVSYNLTLGLNDVAAPGPGESFAMTVCRKVGDVTSMVQGFGEFTAGGGLAGTGVVACGTGVLCFAGAPATLGGGAMMVHGGGVAVMGTWQLVSTVASCIMGSSGSGGGGPPPTPTPPAPAPTPRKPWTITAENTDRTLVHSRFGKFFRHKSTELWWSKDQAGHGGSVWKVFEERSKGLEWIADTDEYGTNLPNKHKGPTGLFIPWKELH